MANDVTFLHPQYKRALPDWCLIDDVVAGERTIKEKGPLYLPKPNAADTSEENTARYNSYIQRAVFFNATGRTLASLSGLAFATPPVIDMPAGLETFAEDVTGTGVPMALHAQQTLNAMCKKGRAGVLVDYPRTEGAISVADERSMGLQPTYTFYDANSITNWRTLKRGSRRIPSLVVLRESRSIESDFEVSEEIQYRVLRLVDGVYVVEIWTEDEITNAATGQKQKAWAISDAFTPLQANGRPWDEIPFKIFGPINNDFDVDAAPLLDLATMNVAHYRNSADFEDSVYMLGQGQIWVSGVDEAWVELLKKNGIYFGSRTFLPVPVGGACGLIQMNENSLVRGAMDQKEKQMAALGARLLMPAAASGQIKTARQVDSEDSTDHSILALCCQNCSKGYVQLAKWVQVFAGVSGEPKFEIQTEFVQSTVDAQLLTAMVGAVQAGTLPLQDFWANLRESGLIRGDKTDAEIREEIDTGLPSLDLGGNDPADQQTDPQGAAAGAE